MGDFAKFFADQLQVAEKIKEIPEYEVIENALLTAIKKAIPAKDIKLHKFGSRITGIGARHSDLDIYVDVGKGALLIYFFTYLTYMFVLPLGVLPLNQQA